MDNEKKAAARAETVASAREVIRGMETTARLMENYQLLKEYTMKGGEHIGGSREEELGVILEGMRRSRADTAIVVAAIDEAMVHIKTAARVYGYTYKVEAFERHYLQGQTYEQIAAALNSGRNSPARWCKEIMQRLAVHLFGVNGIGR